MVDDDPSFEAPPDRRAALWMVAGLGFGLIGWGLFNRFELARRHGDGRRPVGLGGPTGEVVEAAAAIRDAAVADATAPTPRQPTPRRSTPRQPTPRRPRARPTPRPSSTPPRR
ncbi:MAG: hypothetical protein R3F65_01470 [bacterium]